MGLYPCIQSRWPRAPRSTPIRMAMAFSTSSIPVAELLVLALSDSGYKLIGELLGGDIEDQGAVFEHLMPDGVQKVGLAQANATIDKDRIIAGSWAFGCPFCCGMGHAVAIADYERGEGVSRIELGPG